MRSLIDCTKRFLPKHVLMGDPMERPVELVKQDPNNGDITLEQANRCYGLEKRSESG